MINLTLSLPGHSTLHIDGRSTCRQSRHRYNHTYGWPAQILQPAWRLQNSSDQIQNLFDHFWDRLDHFGK